MGSMGGGEPRVSPLQIPIPISFKSAQGGKKLEKTMVDHATRGKNSGIHIVYYIFFKKNEKKLTMFQESLLFSDINFLFFRYQNLNKILTFFMEKSKNLHFFYFFPI